MTRDVDKNEMETVDPQTILLVDDDAFILKTMAFILKQIGYTHVLLAEGAQQALDALDDNPSGISLIITDLNMPEMDGVELLRCLAQREYIGDLILLSVELEQTLDMAKNLARARKLSVLGAIKKPIKADVLQKLVKQSGTPKNTFVEKTVSKVSPKTLGVAIENNQLVPWFQPKIDVNTLEVVGVEALIRWPCEPQGMIFPDAFIPVAEENDLIDKLTVMLINQVVDIYMGWLEQNVAIKIAINVSMLSLKKQEFADIIHEKIKENPSFFASLQLEVTESQLMGDFVTTLDMLLRFRLKQISLSIDDFGTGHSNLSQLRDLPFEELKLDRSYVQGAAQDKKINTILESTVDLAKKLGMTIVAEGVETLSDWERVKQLGCHQVQGYLIARPMPAADIPAWIGAWKQQRQALFNVSSVTKYK